MSNRILLTILAILFPFLAVYVCWAMSLGAFDIQLAFKTDNFWAPAFFYWLIFQWIPIYAIWQDYKPNRRTI